ncbi:unnamed protein product [Aspergillus oryzae]|uniref:Unnamed protein product n=2 Tax=Aspergillus oryzae TaxID=5062 RepID=A0AAN4YD49_ASPOZ|nr:unnamed protein product [Aspergillus oryzae]GMF90508.1 unnamed protein product [Aspergillus oryzae]GMG07462.1 unnamed protein product [Aspergillus oryzae]GMG25939.1 unnamed protein product [Aspergillus oryzae]GMG50974.1 unnamed protein product [Aspergillus oryzae var. brunneus]
MAEEVKDARRTIPRSMVYSVLINGTVALGFTIGLLYTMGSLDDALNTPTGYPLLEIFYAATKSNAAASGMLMMFILPGFGARKFHLQLVMAKEALTHMPPSDDASLILDDNVKEMAPSCHPLAETKCTSEHEYCRSLGDSWR